jgi:hypothetical protein
MTRHAERTGTVPGRGGAYAHIRLRAGKAIVADDEKEVDQ